MYIPMGILIPQSKTLRKQRPVVATPPLSPVRNEARYGSSTREHWPAAWRAKDETMLVALQRALDALCAAKDSQGARDEKKRDAEDDLMDARVDPTGAGAAVGAAWEARKAADYAALLEARSAESASGASGIFDVAALGFQPFGMEETVPHRARRQKGRTQLGGRLHGALVRAKEGHDPNMTKAKIEHGKRRRHADELQRELDRVRDEGEEKLKQRVLVKELDHLAVDDTKDEGVKSHVQGMRKLVLDDDGDDGGEGGDDADAVAVEAGPRVRMPSTMAAPSVLKNPHLRLKALKQGQSPPMVSTRDLSASVSTQNLQASARGSAGGFSIRSWEVTREIEEGTPDWTPKHALPPSPLKRKPMLRRS